MNEVKQFFAKAIAHDRARRGGGYLKAARKPNRRTLQPPPETEHEELWRGFNTAIRLMDVPEAKQNEQWWKERDEVLATWDKLLNLKSAQQPRGKS